MLATGSVDEIQHERATHREIRVRVLQGGQGLSNWLEQRNDVENVILDGELVRFTHEGDRETEVVLLREMVLADFKIAEFGSQPKSLEDVFLQVTRGAVQ